jgi:aryl-alcohol dehydrogenase-like predicted oxidoreductase
VTIDQLTAPRTTLGSSDLSVFPLSLGGNVFGWTADQATSFAVLDAYVAGGGNFIDTADVYSAWVEGNAGGESETIIGAWIAQRGRSDDLVIATKVSQHPEFSGLSADNIAAAARASIERLNVESIDLYYAHFDSADVPLAETVEAFSKLVDAGLIRAIGVSNFSVDRIQEWLDIAEQGGFHKPVVLQPQYNLVERGIEADVLPLAVAQNLSVVPYYALASGFLTGKYRDGSENDSPRAGSAAAYLDDRGRAVLAALDEAAAAHGVEVATVALAWLRSQPGVAAPIASARVVEQLPALLASATLELTPAELASLTAASA